MVVSSQLVETLAYVFTDILFLDSHRPDFFLIKNDFNLLKEKALEMIPKYRRAEAQSWP